ncbi:hypothetical protein, partial [Salmonella sp. SAL04269]
IQPVCALPQGSFILLPTGCGTGPDSNSSPKESVSCASAILFLLCWSRYVLFLLSSSLLVIVVVPIHKQMPCQFFETQ